jgi:hypothetical protein
VFAREVVVSGQAKTARRVELERRRRQVARLAAVACCLGDVVPFGKQPWFLADWRVGDRCGSDGGESPAIAREAALGTAVSVLLAGTGRFDVALARAYGERMLADADMLDEQRATFVEWTKSRGLGPDSRLHNATCTRHAPMCQRCDRGTPGCDMRHGPGGWPWDLRGMYAVQHGALDHRVASGGAGLRRLGCRLLAALEGQPSGCQRAACRSGFIDVGWVSTGIEEGLYYSRDVCEEQAEALGRRNGTVAEVREHLGRWRIHERKTCPMCRGTGHNLAGVLAPVAPSPQQRRKDARRQPRPR